MQRRQNHLLLAIAVVAAVGTSGCRDIYLSDDIDLDFDWNPIEGRGDTLHTPYVVGTQVVISANDVLDQSEDELTWALSSSDEAVLRIDSQVNGRATCTALSAGTATIRVHDEDGEEIYDGQVEVREPDRAELFAHGPLIIGQSFDEALVQGPIRILAGGMGTFLVRYYDGDQRLYGNGVLEAQVDGAGLEAEARQSYLFENREWLSLSPEWVGTHHVELFASGISVGQGVVEAVDTSEVAEVALLAEDEGGASEEEWLAVLALAYDFAGEPIYGVEYAWDIDGDLEDGMGDLYRYEYAEDTEVELGANFQEMRDAVWIHASEGYVSSTNNIGCSAAASRPASRRTAATIALALLGLTLLRRRRDHGSRCD